MKNQQEINREEVQVPPLESRIVAKWYGTAVTALTQAETKINGGLTHPVDQHSLQKILAAYDHCSRSTSESSSPTDIERQTSEMTGYSQEMVAEQLNLAREAFTKAALQLGADPEAFTNVQPVNPGQESVILPRTGLLFQRR